MIPLTHLHRGKVRDLFDAGDDRLLMVASVLARHQLFITFNPVTAMVLSVIKCFVGTVNDISRCVVRQ